MTEEQILNGEGWRLKGRLKSRIWSVITIMSSYRLFPSSVSQGQAVSAWPGSLRCKFSGPTQDAQETNLHANKISRWSICPLKYEDHIYRPVFFLKSSPHMSIWKHEGIGTNTHRIDLKRKIKWQQHFVFSVPLPPPCPLIRSLRKVTSNFIQYSQSITDLALHYLV